MKKIERIVLTLLFMLVTNPYSAFAGGNGNSKQTSKFDWSDVMDAIIQVESNGNRHAKNGNQVGAMQITPILVKDCNQILKQRKSNKRYTLQDRFSIEKSKEMFLLIQSWYNPNNNIEKAIRSWNGGANYSVRGTQKYFEKVLRAMK
ncbi:MAG: transglycosylase SLT domain-containing protein [Prevotella sp.]|jgi:hypothetical protein|nr:transglycosylase SLT domain-containing protein [Prevotella sp.]MBR5062734.1 transglycosylase SLT domain-containing protein [Prevotella sp.]